jgi:uncharacterized protein YidB (DUF937 family)
MPLQWSCNEPRNAFDDCASRAARPCGIPKPRQIGGAGGASPPASGTSQPLGGLLGNLGGMLGGAGAGALLNGGSGELLERFNQNGHGDTAQSWINAGPNKDISPPQLKQAIGSDVLEKLEQQTGLSQEELLARLSRELPTNG